MAWKIPMINVIKPDIKNLSIYLRSQKKWGKTTLFRDMIIEKYGDPSRGLLVGCGNEVGYGMLDNLNITQVETHKDLIELKNWLINEKGKEHNIEIVCFDTGDELVLIEDKETIRQANLENPTKKCKSIKSAFGGFTAGEKYSANDLIKPYINELKKAGFGIWMICHTSFKTIKEKGGLDEDGYMQLTSNLSKDYESAFGDIFDVVLTGVIEREFDEVKTKDMMGKDKIKKYTNSIERRLYFRGTTLIDAGGRFADGTVPEYMLFESGKNNAAEFIRIVEEGMEKSKTNNKPSASFKPKTEAPKVEKEEVVDFESDPLPDELFEEEVIEEINYKEEVKTLYKKVNSKTASDEDKEKAKKVKEIIKEYGKFNDCPDEAYKEMYEVLKA